MSDGSKVQIYQRNRFEYDYSKRKRYHPFILNAVVITMTQNPNANYFDILEAACKRSGWPKRGR